jgi:soluble cytochrome b562
VSRASKTLVVIVVAMLGLWGCAQGTTTPPRGVHAERVKALEAKCAKLEEECRAVTAARDQVRKKLGGVEESRLKLQQEIDRQQAVFAQERADMQRQIAQRTMQRDGVQGQFDDFRKGLHQLLNQADSASANGPFTPVGAAPRTNVPGNS